MQILERHFEYKPGEGRKHVQLASYVAATPDGCDCFLQRPRPPAAVPDGVAAAPGSHKPEQGGRLKQIPVSSTLADSLRDLSIIEFPTIVVRLRTARTQDGDMLDCEQRE